MSMVKFGSTSKAGQLLMASLFTASIAACGGGDDAKILGGPGVLAPAAGAGVPGPAGAAPALGAAAAFGGFGGGAGMTNQGTSTVIPGAQGQPVSIGTTGASTTMTGFHDTSVPYAPPSGCIYGETGSNIGAVNGTIVTDAPPPV